MPEVFTEERKKYQSSLSHSGENNSKVKLSKDDVLKIRHMFESKQKTRKEIQNIYKNVTPQTINSILSYKT